MFRAIFKPIFVFHKKLASRKLQAIMKIIITNQRNTIAKYHLHLKAAKSIIFKKFLDHCHPCKKRKKMNVLKQYRLSGVYPKKRELDSAHVTFYLQNYCQKGRK